MVKALFKPKSSKVFGILAFVLFLTMLTFENINGRFWLNDLKVMYSAAESFLNNEPIYGKSFGLGTGFYKYSPFTLLFFIPYTLFSYKIACVIHFIISSIIAILTVLLSEDLVRKYVFDYQKKYHLTLFVAFVLVLFHLVRDLHLGNINMILVFLIILSLKYLLESKFRQFAFLLAIVILTKPYFVVLILPILFQNKIRALLTLVIAGTICVFASLIIIGFSEGIDLYIDWFNAMLSHSSYLSSNNTIFYLLNRHLGLRISDNYAFLLFGGLAILISLFFWWSIRKMQNTKQKNLALIFHSSILIAIIPNVFITDTEHFLFSLPIITIIVIFFSVRRRFLLIPFLAIALAFYSGSSTDMLGDELNEYYKSFGLLGIGNLLIILITTCIYFSEVTLKMKK